MLSPRQKNRSEADLACRLVFRPLRRKSGWITQRFISACECSQTKCERSRSTALNQRTTIRMHLKNIITHSTDVQFSVCDWWLDDVSRLIMCSWHCYYLLVFYLLHFVFTSIWYLFTRIVWTYCILKTRMDTSYQYSNACVKIKCIADPFSWSITEATHTV